MRRLVTGPVPEPLGGGVSFTIYGWEQLEPDRAEAADRRVVPLFVSNSWRAAWL